jgi:hypothetical protein
VVLDHQLNQIDVLYSYGISTNIEFETEFCHRYNCRAHLYDHTINSLPATVPHFTFHKEGIGHQNTEELKTFYHHLQFNTDQESNVFLKMDVEGAEFASLLEIPDETLKRIPQIVIELHRIDQIDSEEDFNKKYLFLKKMSKLFHVYHVHYNNYDHTVVKCGYRIPQTIEVTYVNKGITLEPTIHTNRLPRKLDYRCKPNRQCQSLDFWPFDTTTFIHNDPVSIRYIRPKFLLHKLKKLTRYFFHLYCLFRLNRVYKK